MKIPMVDVGLQHEKLKNEFDKAFHSVLESGQFILGPNVLAFEKEVAEYCNVEHAIAVASGTDALHLALRALNIGPGDEVITTAFTFIGTAEAISYTGAKPVFVDIDPETNNIDISRIEDSITDRTRAVIAVHLFGQPVNMEALSTLCKKHDLKLIEDCAQAFGAEYQGTKTGAFGDFGCFSFYPSKNLGAMGDAGMVVCNDDELANTIRILRNHGSKEPYHHNLIGYNSRLDELQAAFLRIKFRHIDEFNSKRYNNAQLYSQYLKDSSIEIPKETPGGLHVYHQYTIKSESRNRIRENLGNAGIASSIFYPIPLHKQDVYKDEYSGLSLPHAENAAATVLSLPMYPELTEAQIQTVCQTILESIQ